jgi:hypothetical protein
VPVWQSVGNNGGVSLRLSRRSTLDPRLGAKDGGRDEKYKADQAGSDEKGPGSDKRNKLGAGMQVRDVHQVQQCR